jgi:hypothetical protein
MAEQQPDSHPQDALNQIEDILVNRYEASCKYKLKELTEILDSIAVVLDAYHGRSVEAPEIPPDTLTMRERHSEPVVSAIIHSDDRRIEATFQANRWFSEATDEEIKDLAGIGWGYDLEADRIAYFMEPLDVEVEEVLNYCRSAKRLSSDPIGFEVLVDKAQAAAWLAVHRPGLWEEIAATEQ